MISESRSGSVSTSDFGFAFEYSGEIIRSGPSATRGPCEGEIIRAILNILSVAFVASVLLALTPPTLASEQAPDAAPEQREESLPLESPPLVSELAPPPIEPEPPAPAPQAPAAPEPEEEETEAAAEEDSKEGIDDADWSGQVSEMIESIQIGAAEPKDANALYLQLEQVIWPYQRQVYDELRQRSPDALAHREVLREIYDARIELLTAVTPSFRRLHIGGGTTGMRELGHELSYARLHLFFQSLAIPRGLELIVKDITGSPLDNIWQIIQLVVAILIFRGWRRWAKSGLGNARRAILAVRPRRSYQRSLAKLLWYLDRVRPPLEWLALLFFISSLYEPGELAEIETLAWVTLLWLLMARFAVAAIDAWAARSNSGISGEDSALRLRSLRLIATWLLLLGLGLDLAARYAGEGAIYTWVWRCFIFLALPVAIQLIRWWRTSIFERLREEASYSDWAKRLLKREDGIAGHVNALLGAGYLTAVQILQGTVRRMSTFDAGRRAVALLLRREVDRDLLRERRGDESPISNELAEALLEPHEIEIGGIAKKAFDELIALAESGSGGVAGVLAERGGGLSHFLQHTKERIGDSMLIIDCPPGGFEPFRDELIANLDLDGCEDLVASIRPRMDTLGIRVIAIDNFHRMVRPQMGGLRSLDRLEELGNAVGEDILWVLGTNQNAWPYISRARGDSAVLQVLLELPPWTDEQLGKLIDAHSEAVGIAPDYRRLVFPRQFDDSELSTLEERNRKGFQRILWDLSDGNPQVTMRLYVDSLRSLPREKLSLRLPQPPSSSHVTEANLTTLLVLRVLVQCELATVEDIVASLRLPQGTIMAIIRFCLQESWIERVDDHYRITWAWFRTITRVLARQNLLHR